LAEKIKDKKKVDVAKEVGKLIADSDYKPWALIKLVFDQREISLSWPREGVSRGRQGKRSEILITK
jgi:hypothetical protein